VVKGEMGSIDVRVSKSRPGEIQVVSDDGQALFEVSWKGSVVLGLKLLKAAQHSSHGAVSLAQVIQAATDTEPERRR
jgi:hypothetical protein